MDLNNKKQPRWRLRGCPRCKGDLNYNSYASDWACLQCGYTVDDRKRKSEDFIKSKAGIL